MGNEKTRLKKVQLFNPNAVLKLCCAFRAVSCDRYMRWESTPPIEPSSRAGQRWMVHKRRILRLGHRSTGRWIRSFALHSMPTLGSVTDHGWTRVVIFPVTVSAVLAFLFPYRSTLSSLINLLSTHLAWAGVMKSPELRLDCERWREDLQWNTRPRGMAIAVGGGGTPKLVFD